MRNNPLGQYAAMKQQQDAGKDAIREIVQQMLDVRFTELEQRLEQQVKAIYSYIDAVTSGEDEFDKRNG